MDVDALAEQAPTWQRLRDSLKSGPLLIPLLAAHAGRQSQHDPPDGRPLQTPCSRNIATSAGIRPCASWSGCARCRRTSNHDHVETGRPPMPVTVFRDFVYDVFGMSLLWRPENIGSRAAGAAADVLVSAYRQRVLEVQRQLQWASRSIPSYWRGREAVAERPEKSLAHVGTGCVVERAPVLSEPRNGSQRNPMVGSLTRSRRGGEGVSDSANEKWASASTTACCVRWPDTGGGVGRVCRRTMRRGRRTGGDGGGHNSSCRPCAAVFTPARADGRYSSARCRQAAFRQRVTAK